MEYDWYEFMWAGFESMVKLNEVQLQLAAVSVHHHHHHRCIWWCTSCCWRIFSFFSKVVQEIRLKCCYKTHMHLSKYSLTNFLVYKLSTMKSIHGQMLCCIESVIWAKPEWICFSILVAKCFACIRFDDTLATGTTIHRRIEKKELPSPYWYKLHGIECMYTSAHFICMSAIPTMIKRHSMSASHFQL